MGNSPKVKAALKKAVKKLKAMPPEELRRRILDGVEESNPFTDTFQEQLDAVNHPKHYNTGRIEVIEFIEDQRLGLHLGSTVKYICRAGRKDPSKRIEDLEKALWYLRRKIEVLKAKRDGRAPLRPNDMARRRFDNHTNPIVTWYPPMHANCRSVLVPVGKKRKR